MHLWNSIYKMEGQIFSCYFYCDYFLGFRNILFCFSWWKKNVSSNLFPCCPVLYIIVICLFILFVLFNVPKTFCCVYWGENRFIMSQIPQSNRRRHPRPYQYGPLIGQRTRSRRITLPFQKNDMAYMMGNEFLIIPDALEDVTTTIVSLLSQHIGSFSQELNKGQYFHHYSEKPPNTAQGPRKKVLDKRTSPRG